MSEQEKKLNSQIAVAKNNKTLVEFIDAMYFTDDSAWPEMSSSRIRVAISDYTDKSKKALYKWDNIKVEDIVEIKDNVGKIESYSTAYTENAIKQLQKVKKTFEKNPGVDFDELNEIDAAIQVLQKEKEEALKQIVLYEDHKILPYDAYKNPGNDKERLTTGCRIIYNPAMRFPIIIEVGQGYATSEKSTTGQIKYKGEHDYIALKKMLSLKDFKKIINKVCTFANAMVRCGLQNYYEQTTQQFLEKQSKGIAGDINDASEEE